MAAKEAAVGAAKPAMETAAVELFGSSTAKTYTHIHAIFVLSLYYGSFSSIVANPVPSLSYLLLPLTALQVLYVGICVPQAPDARVAAPSQTSTAGKALFQSRRKTKTAPSWQSALAVRSTPAVVSVILSLTLTTVPLFVVLILHGAPLTTHLPHTLVLAAHLAVLATVPLFYAHGVSSAKWRELYSLAAPIDELTGAAIGTLLGAWVGAVPIPLDWDREWQKWPVTVCTGAYAGWAVGKLLGGSLLRGKRIEFDE